jgi:peptidyl-prolyl cis-trans isomerase D
MQKGQVSDVVKSSYGFHILKADDKQTAHVKPLDEVKDQIRPVIAADKEQQETQREANSLVATARTLGMQKAADKEGQPLQSTDLVPRTAPNLPQGLAEAIFSAREKDPPDLIKIPQGYAVFQVTEIKPPQPPTYEEAKSAVEADYKREKTASMLQDKIQQLAEKARSEHNLRTAAKEFGAEVKTSDLVGPDSQVPDLGSLRGPAAVVFNLKPGEISNPISAGRGSVVVAMTQRQEPPATEFAGVKDKLRDELLDQKRTEALRIFMTNLRDKMQKDGKIKINDKEMQRIGASGRGVPGQAGM